MRVLNRALWHKTIHESLLMLVPTAIIVAGFCWVFVYLMSKLELVNIPEFITRMLPKDWLNLTSIPLEKMATREGAIANIYVHPVVVFSCIAWAMVRGSAAVSGEISRGTMELLLAQPISRPTIIFTQAVTAIAGAAVLAAATLCGLAAAFATIPMKETISVWFYEPAAVNLFFYTFGLCGVCTMVSSFDHYRWRTLGIIGIWGVSQVILDVVVRLAQPESYLKNLRWITMVTPWEPTRMLFATPEEFERLQWACNGPLFCIGALSYVAATIIFSRRDIPAPM
jgi:beta-exotoxin I transport system permease protein